MPKTENGAVTSAVLVHLRVEPAHFDWRWRERPALALLAWEAMARDPLVRLRRIQVQLYRRAGQLVEPERIGVRKLAQKGHDNVAAKRLKSGFGQQLV